jgi:asparagine synthase (glutamine-hydrolysing)
MSGLAAVFNRDGRPVETGAVVKMLDAMAHRGPDGFRIWHDGDVALGHRMFRTTPESLEEVQPHRDETGALVLIFDGRIDNGAELRSLLDEQGLHARDATDAEVVLRSYQCWGEACVEKLLGDFSLALWDARAQSLLCARDAMGIKPLYYFDDGRVFACASEVAGILAYTGFDGRLNEGVIGEILSNRTPSCDETLYASIKRLWPAHTMRVGRETTVSRRFFDLDFNKDLRYRNDNEYAEHFLALFKESLKCRLRAIGPVASHLSGGIDSSSIVCATLAMARSGELPRLDLRTYSIVFPGKPWDESGYIREVAEHYGIQTNLFEPLAPDRIDLAKAVSKHRDLPEYPSTSCGTELRRRAAADGCRVILTGEGGDEWLSASRCHLADLLRRGRLAPLLRELRGAADPEFNLGPARIFVADALLPLLPRWINRLRRKLTGRARSYPDWIEPDFARRISLENRLHPPPPSVPPTTLARRDNYNFFHDGEWHVAMDRLERYLIETGLEGRHPLSDRRIVEFAWAIPEDQRTRLGRNRAIVRNAMRGILPERIRTRATKGHFATPFLDSVKFNRNQVDWRALAIARRGWVNSDKLKSATDKLMDEYKRGAIGYGVPVWLSIAMEIWHNTVLG